MVMMGVVMVMHLLCCYRCTERPPCNPLIQLSLLLCLLLLLW